jgi:hypothetical protein
MLGRASPSDALGRFVPDGQVPIDGSSGEKTRCSEWFETIDLDLPSRPPALWGASPEAAAPFGAKGPRMTTLYLDFAPTKRVGSAIRDPHGLAQCCERSPDQCTSSYIAEVLEGSGRAYRLDQAAEGTDWYAAGRLAGAYGIRLSGNPYSGPDCGSWRDDPPRASHGTFLLGVSTTTHSEENARTDALRQARSGAITWLRAHKKGDALLDEMTEERWCLQAFPGENGDAEHLAQVLAYLPEE